MPNKEVLANNRPVGIYLHPTNPIIIKGNGKTPDRMEVIFETRHRINTGMGQILAISSKKKSKNL